MLELNQLGQITGDTGDYCFKRECKCDHFSYVKGKVTEVGARTGRQHWVQAENGTKCQCLQLKNGKIRR